MAETPIVVFQRGDSVLIYHLWEEVRLQEVTDISDKPFGPGEVVRDLPTNLVVNVRCADNLVVPVTGQRGTTQATSMAEQVAALRALRGDTCKVTTRTFSFEALVKRVEVQDTGQYDNSGVRVSVELRSVQRRPTTGDGIEFATFNPPQKLPPPPVQSDPGGSCATHSADTLLEFIEAGYCNAPPGAGEMPVTRPPLLYDQMGVTSPNATRNLINQTGLSNGTTIDYAQWARLPSHNQFGLGGDHAPGENSRDILVQLDAERQKLVKQALDGGTLDTTKLDNILHARLQDYMKKVQEPPIWK